MVPDKTSLEQVKYSKMLTSVKSLWWIISCSFYSFQRSNNSMFKIKSLRLKYPQENLSITCFLGTYPRFVSNNFHWEISQNLNIELWYDPDIPPLNIYCKGSKSIYQRGPCTSMLNAALFIITRKLNQLRWPSHEEIESVVHMQNGILTIKKNEIMTFSG